MKPLLAALFLILLALPENAQSSGDAIAARERGDYRTAMLFRHGYGAQY